MTIPANVKRFRFAILPCTLFFFGTAMVCVLVIEKSHMQLRMAAFAAGVILAESFFFSFILSLGFPAGFSAEGIYGHSFWGPRRFVAWSEIKNARTFYLLNLKWLRVYSAGGKVLWLGLFQSRPAEFREAIRQFAPSNSPVLKFL